MSSFNASQEVLKQNIQSAIQTVLKLDERIREVAIAVATIQQVMYRLHPAEGYTGYDFEDDGAKIVAHFQEYYRGDTDYDDVEFPTSYLWTDNFVEVEQKRYDDERAAIRAAAEAKELAETAQRAADKEQRDRSEWERLKQKFGDQ